MVVTFLGISVPLSLAILLWRSNMAMWLRSVGVLGMVVLCTAFFAAQDFLITLGAEDSAADHFFHSAILIGLMFTGMASRYFTRAIEVRRELLIQLRRKGVSDTPSIEWDPWEFAYPFFFSVITMGALLAQIPDRSLSVANVVLSFQTGFFWQTVASKSDGDSSRRR